MLALSGCPGEIDPGPFYAAREGGVVPDGGPVSVCPPSIRDVQRDLIAPRCATSGCHTAMAPQSGLDLESPGIVARTLDRQAGAGSCMGRTLLTINGQTVGGLLLGKLASPPACGSRMPIGRNVMFMSEQETQCFSEFLLRESQMLTVDAGMDASAPDAGMMDVPNVDVPNVDVPTVMDVPNPPRDVPNAPRDVPNAPRDVPTVMDVPNRDVPSPMDVPNRDVPG